jgi:tricorn protease
MRPYLVTLRKDLPSPFVPVPRAPGEKPEEKKDDADAKKKAKKDEKKRAKRVRVDLDGIEHRVVAFPVPLGRYGQIAGLEGGRVLFTSFPVEGTLDHTWFPSEPVAKGTLEMFEFDKQEKQTLLTQVTDFTLSDDGKTILYRSARRLRALKAGEKPDEKLDKEGPGRKGGWLDLGRLKVSVVPLDEWRQMYREAWRLQRDHFWTPDMSKVDWERVHARYLPLLERVGTRAEFSDLMWEMQGELGTSHAYEFGGDYRPQPDYGQGHLGADLAYDAAAGGYRITHVVRGDSWSPDADSPLNAPGINVRPGDILTAIGGRSLGPELPPGRLLVNQAGSEVLLTFFTSEPLVATSADAKKPRTVSVKALKGEEAARYREWVEGNRERVHRETGGRVGYVHIPDMGPRGFAEFHRLYLTEYDRDALIVDVRYNGGGHVSQLLLEKLARRRVGYDLPRWGTPEPYPEYSVIGPIVAITNESAGSDGDIFSHCFKLMKLGTLIGKRTWGGVIGIGPRSSFVDGGLTTQPEYSFWFKDVGWGVENYGTDPDIEVDIKPQDYAAGRDTQLERAIRLILRQLKETPPERPDFSRRPDLSLPKLPPR